MIGIVIPWFGPSLKGGAEQQARQTALRLAARGRKVEVLTTCCASFLDDWGENRLPEGTEQDNGVTVRRFPVDARSREVFSAANSRLLALDKKQLRPGVCPVPAESADAFVEHNINSQALLDHLADHAEGYRAFVFLPYLYGVVLKGLPLVADKAFLQPCLHDEAYAYLPAVERLFRKAKGLLFISEGEMASALRLYGPGIFPRSRVMGGGVEYAENAGREGCALPPELVGKRFVLCAARRDPTKNTDFLVQAFRGFRQNHPQSDLRLVLVGPGKSHYGDESAGILDLGLVEEGVKTALMENCLAMANPSRMESYSRSMMEAWMSCKPVLAHADCWATAFAVDACGGGMVGLSLEQWADLFARLDQAGATDLERMGRLGRAYAGEHADWNRVMDRYEALLAPPAKASVPGKTPAKAIHQMLPNLSYGDAISNYALAIRDTLRSWGYASDIHVRHYDARMAEQANVFAEGALGSGQGLIYHHSIGSELTPHAVRHPGPKMLIYHNITPPRFFEPYDREFAALLAKGQRELDDLAGHFPVSAGDSAFNTQELADHGFADPQVLPLILDPGFWNFNPDQNHMDVLQDGRTNILFVGRMSPNKRQDLLVDVFARYLRLDPGARLFLVGDVLPGDAYGEKVKARIRELDLEGRAVVTGKVDNAVLQAFYRTAHLYLSMSEHEGFGVPLVESMWFNVPVLAYRCTAVPHTLGSAGLMFTDNNDPDAVAALAYTVVSDPEVKSGLLKAQQGRRAELLPEQVVKKLGNLIKEMESRG